MASLPPLSREAEKSGLQILWGSGDSRSYVKHYGNYTIPYDYFSLTKNFTFQDQLQERTKTNQHFSFKFL